MKKFITLWKDGFILLFKISVLFYAVRILIMMATFSVAMLVALLLGGGPDIIVYSIVAVLSVIVLPPLTTIAAEHLKITKEKPNKFGHDFSK